MGQHRSDWRESHEYRHRSDTRFQIVNGGRSNVDNVPLGVVATVTSANWHSINFFGDATPFRGGIPSTLAGPWSKQQVPRYFFNVVEGHSKNLVRDSEGTALSDLNEARKEAVGWARDFAKHDFHRPIQTWRVVVTGENGDEVLTVPLSEVRPSKMIRAWFGLVDHIAKFESSFGPRILLWLLAAAILAIVVQAAIKTVSVSEKGNSYQTASAPVENTIVAVRFVAQASLADITEFLGAYKASIVEGPRPGGFYSIRIADTGSSHDQLTIIVGRIAQEKVVEFAAVVE